MASKKSSKKASKKTKKSSKKASKASKKASPSKKAGGAAPINLDDDIYQRIWDADLRDGSGLKAIRKGTKITAALRKSGYVVVDEPHERDEAGQVGKDHILIPEVHIPVAKKKSYERVERLFDNYILLETKPEPIAPEEEEEVQEFIDAILETAPMRIAREYIEQRSGEVMTDDVWWNVVQRAWFEQFRASSDPALTGFEHVVVGELDEKKVQGYHFWYKYFIDENFRFGALRLDLIQFLGNKEKAERTPDVATISYAWDAFDYKTKKTIARTKQVGGFWIGPSVEGLLALGTVRFHKETDAPKETIINDAQYRLELSRSPTGRNVRTFFPKFVQMV